MQGLIKKSGKSNKQLVKPLTHKDLLIEEKRINIVVKNRVANGLLVAFYISVLVSLTVVILKGVKILDVSDTIILSLLGCSVVQIPTMLFAVIKLIFNK